MSTTDPIIRRVAAAPLLWNRPRLRFLEGAADEAASDQDASDVEDTSTDATDGDSSNDTDETDESQEDDSQLDPAALLAKVRKTNAEAQKLRERTKAAEKKATDGEQEKSTLAAENLRLKVAIKHGLPESLAKRLTGDTEEELLKDAEELLVLFGGKKPPSDQPKERLRGGGDPTQTAADPTLNAGKFGAEIFDGK